MMDEEQPHQHIQNFDFKDQTFNNLDGALERASFNRA